MSADETAPLKPSGHSAGPDDVEQLEQALRNSRELTQAVMDSLAAHIAVLDPGGTIVATNAAWSRFARDNSDGEPRNTGLGINYLGICHGACGEASEGATDVENGLRAVLDGSLPEFQHEYPCHSPDAQRWFLLQATGLERGAAGAVLLHINITERKLTEGKLLEAERLRVLTTGLISGQEEERRRLARELHDGLNQQVAALSIDLGLLARETNELLRSEVKDLQKRTINLSEQIRRISHSLHPAALDHLGCASALRALGQEFSRSHEIEVSISIDGQIDEPDRTQSLCLYRVAQECLVNVGKHSGAKTVSLELRALKPDSLELVIVDDGQGFDVSSAQPKAGLGLASMQERVSLAGGCFALDTKPGYGTRIEIQLPRTEQQ